MNPKLLAMPLKGVNTDSLGSYLVSLGLISATTKRWPGIRGCWSDGVFMLLSDELDSYEQLTAHLRNQWTPTTYERWWANPQKADTKARSSEQIWRERSSRPLSEIKLLDSHIVGTGRNVFNPILGTGGNVGKRDLAKACADAVKLLKDSKSPSWLDATLTGHCDAPLPKLNNGGTWFVYANKTYNSGRKWFQEGLISPWSILLATEGAFLMTGGINRRLSARARSYAVFPFVSEPASPETSGEIAMVDAEFWAPIWSNPATLGEVRTMLRRGLARVGNRTARGPHEFSVAAMSAGVDVGIEKFARYELRQTTSSQVIEAIPRPAINVGDSASIASSLLLALIEGGWIDRMPFEPHDSKQKGKFVGLRGPVESAIVRIAESPNDSQRWREMLLSLSNAQQKTDRNHSLRKQCVPIPTLSAQWFNKAWGDGIPDEIQLAKAIASIGAAGSSDEFVFNVYGIQGRFKRPSKLWFPKIRPAQTVWNTGDPLQTLLKVAQRRLIDADDKSPDPFVGTRFCSANLIGHFLSGELDLELIAQWIPSLALIDWSGEDSLIAPRQEYASFDGNEMLHALVKPLFHGRHLFSKEERRPGSRLLRRLFHLLRFNEIDEAIQICRNYYLANRLTIISPALIEADGERIAAALMIPMRHEDVINGLERWRQPQRQST